MSLLEYYIAPAIQEKQGPYRMIRNAGVNQRRIELAEYHMLKFFPKVTREEYEKYILNEPYFEEVLQLVRYGFMKWYDWDIGKIEVNHNFQHSINSYAYVDENFPMFIHVDQLLESVLLGIMLTIFKWAKEYENNKEEVFFKDLLYLLNEVALMGELPNEASKTSVMNKVAIDCQIQNLAADCHWAMLVFTVGHEVDHIYQMNTNRIYWEEHLKEAEFNADKIGYDILLHLIMEQSKQSSQNLKMEEYAYLAPMMYMDIFEMIYYTAYVLYDKEPFYGQHPSPEERKDVMFELVEQDKYQFNTEEGNVSYQWFCFIYDAYKEKLLEYKEMRKLEKIIRK